MMAKKERGGRSDRGTGFFGSRWLVGSAFPEPKMERKNVCANRNGEGGGKWECENGDEVEGILKLLIPLLTCNKSYI